MTTDWQSVSRALQALLSRRLGETVQVEGLERLSGGASQVTWSFDLVQEANSKPLVLRQARDGAAGRAAGIDLDTEAKLVQAAADNGVPVPAVQWLLEPEDGLGQGYIMQRLKGETLPKRILHDARFAKARKQLACQCGEVLARIHAIDSVELPGLVDLSAPKQLSMLRSLYDGFDEPHPVFEAAFAHLAEQAPPLNDLHLVHGDFRTGNLMIDPRGLVAALDWELAHLGDPMEDLGWLCVTSWRFGEIDRPVGGFGERADLYRSYEQASGLVVDPKRVAYWELFGTLKWGVICLLQAFSHLRGQVRSVELAAIGRRVSETELDMLCRLDPEGPPRRAEAKDRGDDAGPQPTPFELTAAVREHLEEKLAPKLAGYQAYQAKVAANALGILQRECRQGGVARSQEQTRLSELLAKQAGLNELNRELVEAIKTGERQWRDAAVLEHLWLTTLDRIAIDQPGYASYRRILDQM